MANVKLPELNALTPPDPSDLVLVSDVSTANDELKKTTVGEVVGIITGDVEVATDGTATISELPVSKLQDGAARQLLQTDAVGTGVEWTDDVDLPGTLDVTGATTLDAALNVAGLASLDGGIDVDGAFTVANATGNIVTTGTLGVSGQSTLASAAVSDLTSGRVVLAGASGEIQDSANLTFNGSELGVTGTLDVSSDATVGGDLTVVGDLTVEGSTTTLETQTVVVKDKNIELGVVDTPTDTTADGGGITLKGATDKTINWVNATDAWTFSEHIELASGKEFYIDGNGVLNATTLGSGVVNSSLTSVGTISTGTWEGDAIDAAYLDSTVVTTSDTGTVTSAMIENGTIVDEDINAAAAIVDTKLDTISTAGKISNSATTATDANTANAIVARDASGDFTAGNITAASFIPTSSTIPTNGVYLPASNSVAFATNGAQALYIDSDGDILVADGNRMEIDEIRARDGDGLKLFDDAGAGIFIEDGGNVGVGTSSPGSLLHLHAGSTSNTDTNSIINFIQITDLNSANNGSFTATGNFKSGIKFDCVQLNGSLRYGSFIQQIVTSNNFTGSSTKMRTSLIFGTRGDAQSSTSDDPVERLRIDDQGRVGIGTSPGRTLDVNGVIRAGGTSAALAIGGNSSTPSEGCAIHRPANDEMAFVTDNTERARIDSSGRLLVGTSTSSGNNNSLQIYSGVNTTFAGLFSGSSGGGVSFDGFRAQGSKGSESVVLNGDGLLRLRAYGYSGAASDYVLAAEIKAEVDGTPDSSGDTTDMPGRLVFSVTVDGASSPTEALRISNDRSITVSDGGNVVLGTTTGTKIGTATSQKIGFYNATPVVQPTTGVAEAAFVENSGGTAVNVDSTFGGYTIQQIVEALQTLGLLA